MTGYFSIKSDGGKTKALELCLEGRWAVSSLAMIDKAFPMGDLLAAGAVTLNGKALEDFDTSAAWYISDLKSRLEAKKIPVVLTGFQDRHNRIFSRISALAHEKEKPERGYNPLVSFFNAVGERLFHLTQEAYQFVSLLGRLIANFLGMMLLVRKVRLRSIVYHVYEVGIKAIPIIALMAFSIAVVTGYQGAAQLAKFGATIFTVDLVVLSTLREMGVLLTAIMLAGRSGSSFAAQIGTMKLNEEVAALQTMGVSPFEILVLPRIIAILIALPLLTFIADIAGLLGAYVFSSSFMEISYLQFLSRLQEVTVNPAHFWVGIAKAPVFALLIGMVGCMQGMQVKGSAEEVGRRTTKAVVQSIFMVIVADAFFSILFTRLGI